MRVSEPSASNSPICLFNELFMCLVIYLSPPGFYYMLIVPLTIIEY